MKLCERRNTKKKSTTTIYERNTPRGNDEERGVKAQAYCHEGEKKKNNKWPRPDLALTIREPQRRRGKMAKRILGRSRKNPFTLKDDRLYFH